MGRYAALPYPLAGDDDEARVYFSGRDGANRSSIGAVGLDLGTLAVTPGSLTAEPLLSPGSLGAFDDSGCTMSCAVRYGSDVYLYYTGWSLGRTVPFYFGIGLAVSRDGGRRFERVSEAPVVGRHRVDPYLCASPSVLVEDGRWRMWYVSATHWEETPAGPRHHYLVKYAESRNGIEWQREGHVAIGFAGPGEHAFGRPHVLRQGDSYCMWYCVRGASYRLGFARSPDGYTWTREDARLCLDAAPQSWEEEMQAYPTVVRQAGRWWLLYNGNGYGATGFGIAEGVPTAPGGGVVTTAARSPG